MAKKTKQPTLKEQVYQSIANSHVQQAVQNNGVAQLQAEYDAWKNQSGVQALQTEYDNWMKAQTPTQTVNTNVSTPKTQKVDNTVKFKTAAERRAIKAEQDKKLAPFDPEKSYAKRFGNNAAKEKTENLKQASNNIGGGVNQIPSLDKYMKSMEGQSTTSNGPSDWEEELHHEKVKQARANANLKKAQSYLDVNKKLTKEEAKEAKKLAIEGLKEFRGRDPKTLTPEELERRATYTDLQAKSSTLIPLSVGVANKGVHMGLSAAKLGAISLPVFSKKATDAINNLEDKWDEAAAPSIELAQGAAPITSVSAGDIADVALGGTGALIPDSVWNKMSNKVDINPYETGEMATMLASYMLTNPLFDKIAGGEKASRVAKFAINQLGQNLQDIALDTSQVVEQGLKDGSINADEAKQIRDNIFWNAVFNAVFGIGGEVIKGAGKAANIADADNIVREATRQAPSANELYRQNALEGLDKLQKVNQGYEFGYHNTNPENVFRSADDITDATNKQFSDLMNEYKGEFQDNSAMKNIYSPEDLEAAQNDQFSALMKQRPQELPKTELPLEDSLKPVGEAPALTGNSNPSTTFGFTPLQEEIESDLKVIAEPMNKLSTTGYMDNITDADAIKKWNALNDAYDDYVTKTTFGGTYDEINNARKKMESTRKAFARAMEEIDPEVARSFNTSSYGKAVGRPAYKALGTELTPEQIEKNYRAILEAEGYEPEQIEAMIKEADIRGNMSAAPSVDDTIESAAKTQQVDNIAKNTTDNSMNMDLQHFGGDNPSEPNWKVSQAYTNTGKNGGGWTEAEYNKYTDPKYYVYESIDEEQSVKSAIDMRAKEGREAFKKRVMSAERMSSVEIDGLMMEWRETVEEARALEAAGKAKEADKLWWESNKIFRTIQEQSTDNAQALQALAKWSRNTPEGMLTNAENIINGKVKPQESELKKALDKWAKRGKKKVEFSPEFEKEFLNEAEKINGLHGAELDTPEAKEVMAKLGKMVNDQIPVKLSEKLQTYLMDSMLGNFRTLISRNAGGNIGLNAIEQFTQRPLAAGIDSLVAKKTGMRTQAGLSLEGLTDYFEGFKKGLADELSDVKSGLHTARSGENTLENAISSNRRIFKTKLLNLNDQLVRHGLSVGDRPFYESVYKQTLGDYQRLYDRGLMGDVVQSLKPDEFKAYAETAAHLNALSAVYQQDSMFSKGLMELKKGIGQLSQGAFGVDILSQFSMPFVKTPANVIERAIDYSPLGMIRNSLRTGAEVKAGAFDQNRFVNETARNIIGTTGMGAGVGLAKNGVFSGSYSDDKDVKQAQKEHGEQEYAWNVPEQVPFIGGKQMDISWIPVLGSNMVASAAAYDAYKNGEGDRVGNIATGLEKGGEALFDQSMFQGLQRLFGTGNSYDSDKGIVGNAGETIKSGLGQAIPSLARQTAQVLDPYQRDISNSNKDVSFGPMDNYNINSLVNNLPKVREKYLAPKVDTQGNLMMENQGRNVGSKILEDMILPGKLTEIKSDALNDEAQRLAEANHSNKAFIPKADRKVVDQEASEENEGHILTNEEWVDYQQKYYKALNDAGLKLIDSDYYKGLDDAEKEAILDNTYKAIRTAVNSEYTGKEVNGASKAYIEAGGGEKGSKAVINYYTAKSYVEKAGTTMSSKTGESIKAAIGRNDYEAAEKIANKNATYKAAFEKYGMENTETNRKMFDQYGEEGLKQLDSFKGYGDNKTKAFNVYQNAKSIIPGLSTEQFKKQYDAIDGSGDKGKDDGSVTQGEMISFLNKGNYSEAEATKYWNAYGNAWKATLYKTKKGKWAYKTK